MYQSVYGKRLKNYVLLVFLYLFVRMNSYFTRGTINEQLLLVGRIIIIAVSVYLLFCIRFVPRKGVVILAIATGICFFLTGAQNFLSTADILANLVMQMWWNTFFIVTYLIFTRLEEKEKKQVINMGIAAFYVFAVRYAIWLLSSNRYWSAGGINSIYYCLLLLPLCYFVDKKTIRYSMIFVAALLTIISGKRTALISVILCSFLPPVLEKNEERTRKKTGALLFLAVVCIALVYVSEYLSQSINITILQRMQSLQEDGGSGRITTYALVWEGFKKSDITQQLFGHGFNAVFLDRVSISSAHNDFLEVLYDYGVIGLVLYASLLIAFVRESFRLRKAQGKAFSGYTAALLIYLTLSCVSHLIIYPTYIVLLLFVFSIGFAEDKAL